jgi:hypothetical protein
LLSIVQARLVGLAHFTIGYIFTYAPFVIASTLENLFDLYYFFINFIKIIWQNLERELKRKKLVSKYSKRRAEILSELKKVSSLEEIFCFK